MKMMMHSSWKAQVFLQNKNSISQCAIHAQLYTLAYTVLICCHRKSLHRFLRKGCMSEETGGVELGQSRGDFADWQAENSRQMGRRNWTSVHQRNQHKGVNQRSKYVTQVQQERPESPTVTLTWHACKYKVHKLHQRYVPNKPYGFCGR